MELGGVGNMPECFWEPAGATVKLSRPRASRGFGMSTDADLPLRAIPRADTVAGAMLLFRWEGSCERSLVVAG